MKTAVDSAFAEAFAKVQSITTAQTNRLLSELQSLCDGANTAKVQFNMEMEQAEALRAKSATLQSEAIRRMDTAMTELATVAKALVMQLEDGTVVTGDDTRMPRAPKARRLGHSTSTQPQH